jgi:hypothetical protein
MGLAERCTRAHLSNLSTPQQYSTISPMRGDLLPGRLEGITAETKGLSEEKCVGHEKQSKNSFIWLYLVI